MSKEDKHDELFLNVLKEEGQILPFLNSVFGFLYRRTDFYLVKDNQDGKIGFLPGVAELAVRDTFRKWQKIAAATNGNVSCMENSLANVVIHEEEVVTTDYETEPIEAVQPTEQEISRNLQVCDDDISSDTYNGADRGSYRWSQTLTEVDIKVPVPNWLTSSKGVTVEVGSTRVTVSCRDHEGRMNTLVEGELNYKHLREESIWTLTPGKHVTIHLEKANEQWWDSIFKTEDKLDTTKFDTTRHINELREDDKMQVEKILVREENKRLGILPPEHQEKIDILKKAWNAQGSPFQGQPFDPSVLQLPQ
ncbi:nudC domain-containing protein 3-like [Macrosteles quadrilineatus]|uniref:nudC domain-containing protein 3-like n=1 Tax=Macrosteles quadrilineatus TaxID=74068 RepID=UPI0023E1FC8B|nr:nudC domain-containing protein 3-like [Macrosteles quadrilineatus]